jgi:virginiamycin B lyase
MKRLALLLVAAPLIAHAGGSNYGIMPGAHPDLAGKVSEWPVPTPRFARDPAVAPDGSIYIAVMSGNKVARFDPKAQSFKEWDLPPGHHPHGLLVDRQGMVWTTGNGNGTIGRLDPASGRVTEFKTPSGGGGPHTLIITDDQSAIWFTMQSGNKVASLATKTGAIKEYPSSGGPYGLAFDHAGNIWFCRMGDNKMGRLDPKSGQMAESTRAVARCRAGSRPRRTGRCGSLSTATASSPSSIRSR